VEPDAAAAQRVLPALAEAPAAAPLASESERALARRDSAAVLL
jgi:hypothetical protein